MEIASLHLQGYKYLQFSEISDIQITPKHKIQLITGQIGSGKTKLMQMYAPIPPQSTLFAKNGYKELVIQHHEHEYILEYDGVSKIHSFRQDGTELNTSGTAAVQEELVYTHLGYDKLIDKLIFNKMRMTQMTSAARMEFLISLNPINVKFIKDKHTKIAAQCKKVKSQLELLQRRASEYKSNLMSQIDYEKYLADREQLQTFDNYVLKLIHRYDTLCSQIDSTTPPIRSLEEYQDLYKRLTHFRAHLQHYGYPWSSVEYTVAEIERLIQEKDRAISDIQNQRATLSKEIDELEALIAKSNTTDLTALETKYGELKKTLSTYPDFTDKIIVSWPPKENKDYIYGQLHRLQDTSTALADIYSRPIWSTKKYAWQRDRWKRLIQKRDDLSRALQQRDYQCTHLKADLSRVQSDAPDSTCVSTTCPYKIRHDKLIGTSKSAVESCVKEIQAMDAQYKHILKILAICEGMLEYQSVYHTSTGVLQDIHATIQSIQPDLLRLFPKGIDSIVEMLNTDLHTVYKTVSACLQTSNDYTEYVQLSLQVKELEVTISTHKKDISISFAKKKLQEDYTRYSTLEKEYTSAVSYKAELERELAYRRKMQATIAQTQRYCTEIEKDVQITESQAKYTAYSSTKSQLEDLHAHIATFIRDMDTVIRDQNRYQDLEKAEIVSIQKLTQELAELDTIEKVLNPYSGLPAIYTKHHITKILKNVNYFIAQVLSYPLTVTLVEDQKEMKYKFMVLADNVPTGDISNCSDGQMEIIDLAFTLSIMIALGLHQTHPLFLDEVGRCLDTAHAQRLLEMLHRLVDEGYIHQLFLINHQAILTGGFDKDSADIVCLRTENTVVPETYNEVVEMS